MKSTEKSHDGGSKISAEANGVPLWALNNELADWQERISQGELIPSTWSAMSSCEVQALATELGSKSSTDANSQYVLRQRFCGCIKMLGQVARQLNSALVLPLAELYAKYGFLDKDDWHKQSRTLAKDIRTIAYYRRSLAAELAFRDDRADPVHFPDTPYIRFNPDDDIPHSGLSVQAANKCSLDRARQEYFLNYPTLEPNPKDPAWDPYLDAKEMVDAKTEALQDATSPTDLTSKERNTLRLLLKASNIVGYTVWEVAEKGQDENKWREYFPNDNVWPERSVTAFRKSVKAMLNAGLNASAHHGKDAIEAWRDAKNAYAEYGKARACDDERRVLCVRFLDHLERAFKLLLRDMRAVKPQKRRRRCAPSKEMSMHKKQVLFGLEWLKKKGKKRKGRISIAEIQQHILFDAETGEPRKWGDGAYAGDMKNKTNEKELRNAGLDRMIRRALGIASSGNSNDPDYKPYRKFVQNIK